MRSNAARSVYQVLTYLPKFMSTVVMTSLVTMLVKQGSLTTGMGIVSQFLVKIGAISFDVANAGLLNNPAFFRSIYQISGIWESAGYDSIVFFAAIIAISPTSYEAAQIDGADKWAQMRYVVLPSILSTIVIMLITRIGSLLNIGYEKVLLLYNPNTYVTADVVSTFANRNGMGSGAGVGIAAAAEMMNNVIGMLLVIGANTIARKASKIFKVISYTLLTVFALCCLYPFVYAISASISGRSAVEYGQIVLFPKDIQFDAFKLMFNDNMFWNAYSNTLFLTLFGTLWSMFVAILGGCALSKKRLLFRKTFNFFLVFTMWFSAGIVPQYLNYLATKDVFNSMGIMDDKWLVVIAMGMAAMNIILLRNAFEGVPSEIEEAAIVDGATEMQVLTQVYLPMSKSTIATVALFFAISRWNGYFWARQMISNQNEHPLQVFIRLRLEQYTDPEAMAGWNRAFASDSVIYALIVCSIVPILIIYPFIQKYFAKGTNVGGVKE